MRRIGFTASGGPKEAYLDCMDAYLRGKTELGWYLCLEGDRIVGGMGVIENDFHNRKNLSPNICAVYTDAYRSQGIAGQLLNMVAENMRNKGISPLYLSPITPASTSVTAESIPVWCRATASRG